MTPAAFARLALALPEAAAAQHHGTQDFRVRGRIFATAGRKDGHAVIKLTPDQQHVMCAAEPDVFAPVDNKWGLQGWTTLALVRADVATVRSALQMAWRNVAPRSLQCETE